MANTQTIQILLDGPRNTVIKVEGVLDTSDVALVTIADPATLAGTDDTGTLKAGHFLITKITHTIEDGLAVNLFWDATTDVAIYSMTGRGCVDADRYGGLKDSSGAGSTGKIAMTTQGWVDSGLTLAYSFVLELVKTS